MPIPLAQRKERSAVVGRFLANLELALVNGRNFFRGEQIQYLVMVLGDMLSICFSGDRGGGPWNYCGYWSLGVIVLVYLSKKQLVLSACLNKQKSSSWVHVFGDQFLKGKGPN